MNAEYEKYMLDQLKTLLKIDSTTGDYRQIQEYVGSVLKDFGYKPEFFNKGGLAAAIGGEGSPVCVSAHMDDIGLMVHRILDNGLLQVCPVGGLKAPGCEHSNVRVKTRDGRIYTGTLRRKYASLHTKPDEEYNDSSVSYEKLFIYLDEDVKTRDDVEKLGIRRGDIIALDPATVFTDSGYIKSRFLDDKACVALLLAYLYRLKKEGITPSRKVTAHFAAYEEIGHGGCCGIPEDTEEFLALDVGVVGPGQESDEHKVTVIAKDSRFPYHYETCTNIVNTAEDAGVAYALDVHLPHYGSDGDCALTAGYDVRHSAFGPGVLETHGYERTHVDSLRATFDLLTAYLG